MKLFLAFRFTGEDPKVLKEEISLVTDGVRKAGHEVFDTFVYDDHFQQNKFTKRQILEFGLRELDTCDALLAYIKSPEKSEGMLIEIGYALARGKPIYVVIKEGVKTTFLTEIAQKSVTFASREDLPGKVREILEIF